MSNKKASKALLSRLAETVIEEFSQDDLYVAQVPPGVFLGKEHFQVLQKLASDRLDDPESLARLVEISRLVDCIQIDEKTITTPDTTPGYLSERFSQIVRNVKFVRTSLDANEQRRYEQAQALLYEEPNIIKKTEYQDFCLLRADLEKKEVALTEMRLNREKATSPEEQSVLTGEITSFEALVKEKREAIDALDRVYNFRAAERIIDAAERSVDQIPTPVLEMLSSMNLLKISDPISHATHIGCNFSPSHLSEDNWIPLKLTREDIAKWKSNGDTASESDTGLADSEIDTITLEVQTVTCSRPWLWSALFKHQHWQWQSPSPPVSNGTLNGRADNLIPAYIVGLILARNFVVKGVPSAQKQFAQAQSKRLDTSDLLNYAITPTETLSLKAAQLAETSGKAVLTMQAIPDHTLRMKSAVTAGRVAPLISRSAMQPALTQANQFRLADSAAFKRLDVDYASAQINPKVFQQTNKFRHRIGRIQLEALMMPARGRVIDPQGRGLYQAVVTIQTSSGERSVHTGQDGHFTARLPQGRYAVQVDKPGFITARGFIAVPQVKDPPVITMSPAVKEQLKISLVEQGSEATYPFIGSAKVVIEGDNTQQVETFINRSDAMVSLSPGKYTVMVTSETAEKILPPSQAVVILPQGNSSNAPQVQFTIYPAPQIINPEVQLLGFICKRVPPCPTHYLG
ncbi:carboxypeptidase-like regulatory domain-containing protein [Trichocoleus desertorum AS-A10]|uniref:carboxypeptidase-like regulatory domain-containing protein n=1 Tax=Trichocoleus desertorum TaxID=1481672 RepID=UPI00329932B8